MDYVPKADQLQKLNSTWLVDTSQIRGVYGNMDVDSVVFTYTTTAEGKGTFWAQLHKQAEAKDWQLVEEQANIRWYERIIPRTGQQAFHSAEQSRIAYNPKTKTVAWVQADESELPEAFANTNEGKWAERVIWSKFQELVSE